MPLKTATRISQHIQEKGGRALAVGGYVRDLQLQLPSKDLDLEVYGFSRLESVIEALQNEFKMEIAGQSYRVLKVFYRKGEIPIDISLPQGTEQPGLGLEEQLHEAFRRRDLTINAMGLDLLSGELLDPFGGLADLKAGMLRAVDPITFILDPLRVLRGIY